MTEHPTEGVAPISDADTYQETPNDPGDIAEVMASDPIEFHQTAESVHRLQQTHEKKMTTGKKLGLVGLGLGGIAGTVGLTLAATGFLGGVPGENKNTPPAAEPTAEAPATLGQTAAPTEAPVVNPTPQPTDIPTSSFEATPTPIESETSQPTANETEQGGTYTYLELKEMDATTFIDLPLSDRAVFMHGMLDYADERRISHFGKGLGAADTSDLYEYNPNYIASSDNTTEEIIMQVLYYENLIRMQKPDSGSGDSNFNLDLASKVAAGAYITPDYINDTSKDTVEIDKKNAVDSEKHFSVLIGELQHQGTKVVKYAQTIDTIHEESNIREVTDTDGNTRYVAKLKYTLSEGLLEAHPNWLDDTVKYVEQEAVYSEDESLWLLTKSSYTAR